jgi:cyclopropane fatty-acyl-phospholipid synthase-like methyltransferase
MTAMPISLGLLFIFLYILLIVYFFYTVVAIIRGAPPIPSLSSTVERMMRLAEIKPGESLIDLGSGDGRILFAASKHGAECLGIEINPLLVWVTRFRAWATGASKVTVRRTNLWKVDVGAADVITVYMVPMYMRKLQEKLKSEMKPGSRILAAVHPFPDWEPTAQEENVFVYRLPG